MLAYGYDYLFPSLTACLLYIQCLVNSMKNITSVKNYISGAKTFVVGVGGQPAAFDAPLVFTVIRGAAKLSTHIPSPAPPIARRHLLALSQVLMKLGPDGRVAMAALLFGVATFLRQCNFLPPSRGRVSPHLITRRDISRDARGLLVRVRSTKTRMLGQGPTILLIARAPRSPICPVEACLWAWRAVPASDGAPLFLLPSSGSPLTAPALLRLLRAGLTALGHPHPEDVTLHSLRRTGALLAAAGGCPDAEVMAHGTWTSGAYRAYVPRLASSSVPAAIASVW